MPRPLVTHVSDTARWVAARRAAESTRPDALFRDPLAARLAGDRGREIAAGAAKVMGDDWFLVTRTRMIDDQVAAAVAAGCELVLNLGAGLDTRPYRMMLPDNLIWVEADLPGLVDEKNALLADETPRCRMTRAAVDLTDHTAVAALLDATLAGAEQALVLTEGLVMYLSEPDVLALATAFERPEIAGWCLDFSAAGVARLMAERKVGLLRQSPLKFLPHNGIAFFEDHGWQVAYLESIHTAADRLGRMSSPHLRAALDGPQPDPRAPGSWPYSAVTRLVPARN
ncbi:SAM-dependent methyltransferase [Nocardia sp. SYP-A9097]|uniref:class I SAM-dependent methyltransferase n=1 Tax=Nocardia sp. SYP-A9097 TaxID=2663237 RepID=UPI00129A6A16|nr:SAM-dependent methyltransferase [Nocardia sp. SYP-A9097]MRH89655.1 SAM-dependent methyltransferase [Nocardia sp. SYP-A9097]